MSNLKLFEDKNVRSVWSEEEEKWYFSVVDVIGILTDSVNPTDYLKKLRKRDEELGTYIGTNCPQVEYSILTAEIYKATFGMTPKKYKEYKSLQRENLRDHMTDLELIFTMLGEAQQNDKDAKNSDDKKSPTTLISLV